MDTNSAVVRSSYVMAAMLFFLPLSDALAAVWPFHLSLEQWRFGAVGVLCNSTLIPLAGLLLALITARGNDHRRVRRIVGWLCALFAVVLGVLALMFMLDYLQTRNIVHAEYRHAMGIATAIAAAKLVLTILTLAVFAPAGIRGGKGSGRKDFLASESSQTPLIPVAGSIRIN